MDEDLKLALALSLQDVAVPLTSNREKQRVKMIVMVRKDLQMTVGKVAAQVSWKIVMARLICRYRMQ